MILNNLKMIGEDKPVNIRIADGKITDVSTTTISVAQKALNLKFEQALVFPGIINSHDHLDFNLFPKLGNQTYPSYKAWGNDIHTRNKEEIADILKIPFLLRVSWGLYKNLLCGVTTVVNHGDRLYMDNELITIFENTHCLHSVQFEKYWQIKLNDPLKVKLPAVIHIGEGQDWPSHREIERLIRWNIFRKKLIGVHAVAMTEKQAKKFKAVVWCPQSNYFLLNKTSRVDLLKNHTRILFGTDSTLTGNWNFWAHLTTARKTRLLSDKLLYDSLNRNAVNTWKLNCGKIGTGKDADIVIAKVKEGKATFDSFFGIGPSDLLMVIHNGNVRLFDEIMLPQLETLNLNDFSRVYLNNSCKYVQGDLPSLMDRIKEYQPKINFPVSAISPN